MSAHLGPSQAASVSTRPSIGAVTTWESGYRRAVLVTDLVIIAVCLRTGLVLTDGSLAGHLPGALAGMTAVVLLGSFFACRVWEQRVLGQGAEELRRLGNAVLAAAVVLSLTALAVDVGFFRPWVFAVIPATGLCLLTSRYALRRVLHARRDRGLCMHPVLVAGSLDEVADLIDRTRRESYYGWTITGVCIPGASAADKPREVRGVPVVGGLPDVPELVRQGDYRVVAVAHERRSRPLATSSPPVSASGACSVCCPMGLTGTCGPGVRLLPEPEEDSTSATCCEIALCVMVEHAQRRLTATRSRVRQTVPARHVTRDTASRFSFRTTGPDLRADVVHRGRRHAPIGLALLSLPWETFRSTRQGGVQVSTRFGFGRQCAVAGRWPRRAPRRGSNPPPARSECQVLQRWVTRCGEREARAPVLEVRTPGSALRGGVSSASSEFGDVR